jgi:N-acyl homoserine lactone hydrolase
MMISLLAAMLAAAPAQTAPAAPPEVALWRLDCGDMRMPDFSGFADDYSFDGVGKVRVASCYLIKHGEDYLLWDAGLSGDLAGKPMAAGTGFAMALKRTIVDQLKQIGVTPAQVKYAGISHYHYDHTGQLADFPGATLLIGTQDYDYVKNDPPAALNVAGFAPWLKGGAKVEPVGKDRDVFGDRSVVMLAMPGHTPGHHALLVRLKGKGAVLISGDQFHATESYERDLVPAFNASRTDTLASHDRFKDIARSLKATVVIQHEPADVGKLPAFPEAAR